MPKGSGVWKVYADEAGGWRWRLSAPNGKVLADSGESYTKKYKVEQAIQKVIACASVARIDYV